MSNVAANSDVLVVDMVGGLLTGAVAERLGGLQWILFPGFFILIWHIVIIDFWNERKTFADYFFKRRDCGFGAIVIMKH